MVVLGQREDWASVSVALGDSRALLNSMKDFNPQQMSKLTQKKLLVYLENPQNTSQSVRSASMVAGNLMQWVEIVNNLFDSNSVIEEIHEDKRNANDQVKNLVYQLKNIGVSTVKATAAHGTFTAKHGAIFDYNGNIIVPAPEVREDPFQLSSARR